MSLFLGILKYFFLFLLASSIIGIINPNWISGNQKKKITRKDSIFAVIFFLVAFAILTIYHGYYKGTENSLNEGLAINESPSINEFKDDYDFTLESGETETSAISWFIIDGEKFLPEDNRTIGRTLIENYTMADKPAIWFGTNSFSMDNKEVLLEVTLNKALIKEGVKIKSIKSFDNYNDKVLSLVMLYENKRFHHDLYDEFNDTYAEVTITEIRNDIVYGFFEGKLYDTRIDKNSIQVKGSFKFKLEEQ